MFDVPDRRTHQLMLFNAENFDAKFNDFLFRWNFDRKNRSFRNNCLYWDDALSYSTVCLWCNRTSIKNKPNQKPKENEATEEYTRKRIAYFFAMLNGSIVVDLHELYWSWVWMRNNELQKHTHTRHTILIHPIACDYGHILCGYMANFNQFICNKGT